MSKRLGELLVDAGRLDADQLAHALRLQADSGMRLGELLVQLGLVAERDVAQALSHQLGLRLVRGSDYPDAPVLREPVSREFLKNSRIVPLREDDDLVEVAVADPVDPYPLEALRLATGKNVVAHLGVPSEVESAVQRQYGDHGTSLAEILDAFGGAPEDQDLQNIQHLRDLASEGPIIRLVNLLIARALEARASDIHIEPFEHELKVRYRIDGVLRDVEAPPVHSTAAVISRIKVMANLNIAERRLPQDGRIRIRIEGREFDMRISTVPTLDGESVVMRILDKSAIPLDFMRLGFSGRVMEEFAAVLARPQGIILVTGPTGSGKTTTLYTSLQILNTPERKILTVEDPVEYQLRGINQIQVKPQIGLSFANALRSILRQDPDVIMIGEMRDLETAKIAVQSALTGHKVFSTLHTNDAPSSVTRLIDMGVEDYLVTSTVDAIVAQRLVRTLCTNCRDPYVAPSALYDGLHLGRFAEGGDVTLHRAIGCEQCDGTGYRGRSSIVELLLFSDPIREVVLGKGDAGAIMRVALAQGMATMYDDGLGKAVAGITTVEEVARVVQAT